MKEAHYPSVTPGLAATVSNVTTDPVPTPSTTTVTLPGPGIYLMTVSALLNGSTDHSMTGLFVVFYSDQTNDVLSTQQVGTTVLAAGSSFGLDTLTASDPDAAGVITLSAAWTAGSNRAVIWPVRIRKLAPFGF